MKIGIKDVLYRVRPFFILYLLVFCICLIIKLMYSREVIFFTVNRWNSPWADVIEPWFTDMGEGWTTIILSVIVALFSYRKALLFASGYAVSSLAAQILKKIFEEPRPSMYFRNQWSHVHIVKGIYIMGKHSFPSGHTVTAFSTALIITYLCRNKNWGIPAFFIAVMIGYSRMYLTQHFFEDVLAGSVIGVMSTIFWLSWLDGKTFIHTDKWKTGLLHTLKPKQAI